MWHKDRPGTDSLKEFDHISGFVYGGSFDAVEREGSVIPSLMKPDALFVHDIALFPVTRIPVEKPADSSANRHDAKGRQKSDANDLTAQEETHENKERADSATDAKKQS